MFCNEIRALAAGGTSGIFLECHRARISARPFLRAPSVMGSRLAATLLVLACCAPPIRGDGNFLGDLFANLDTMAKDVAAARLNDTRPHPLRTLSFLLHLLVQTVQRGVTHLDLFHPFRFLVGMLPSAVAVALVALSLLPPLIYPVKIAALMLAVLALFDHSWDVFNTSYLQQL